MTVIVTGAAGFIGFHVAQALQARGERVVGIDNLNDYYEVSLKEARLAVLRKSATFSFVKADISDRDAIFAIIDANSDTSGIVHLAAQAGVRYSRENPYVYIQANVMGQVVMLEAARRLKGLQHFVYASSSSVYGANTEMPFAVGQRVEQPISLYAATKRADELISYTYSHLYSIPQTGLRFFTVYGPWGRPDMALFRFTDAILSGRPIEVYGEGKMERDFTYVSDLIEAIMRLMPLPPAGAPVPFRIVNIGGGQPIGLMTFIETLERALGKPAIRNMLPMQQGDVPRTYASPELLKQLTGFYPQMGLAQGIGAFVNWYRDYYRK